MKKKNLIINGIVGLVSFGLGSLATVKLIEASLADYVKKNDKGAMDRYKDNEIIMGYYNHWKKNRA